MAYTTLTDLSFAAAPATTPGAAANSTTGVPGLIDLTGNVFSVTHPLADNDGQGSVSGNDGGNSPLVTLYSDASRAVLNGQVSAYSDDAHNGQSKGAAFRVSAANGGTGYTAFLYNGNKVFIVVNGANAVNGQPTSAAVTGQYELRCTCQQVDAAHTQITVAAYAAGDPATPLFTPVTYTDDTPGLQNVAGIMGFTGGYSGTHATRLVFARANAVLSAGSVVAQPFRTVVQLTGQAATGGTAPLAYQYYRATTSGFTPGPGNLVAGATGLAYTDGGLAPGTAYAYRLVVTDAAGASVTYPEVGTTTFPADLAQSAVMLHAGDSITVGVGSSALDAVDTEVANLNAAGVRASTINLGVQGANSANWLKGSAGLGFYENLVAQGNRVGADTVSLLLGTNDSKASVRTSPAQYGANLQSTCANLLADIPTLRRIVLNEPPAVVPLEYSSDYDAQADVQIQGYIAQLDALDNGTTIRRGSTVTNAYFQAHPDQLADGVHPNQAGHTALGGQWSDAFLARFAAPRFAAASVLATGTAGRPFSYQAAAANAPTSFAATGLPTGLNITATGLITGARSTAGAALINLTATNANGHAAQLLVLVVGLNPADVRAGTVQGDGTVGTCHVPGADDTLAGVSVDGTVGNVTLPLSADLRQGARCGVGGTSLTGTLAPAAGGALTPEQAVQLTLVATEIVKVPRAGLTYTYTNPTTQAAATVSIA